MDDPDFFAAVREFTVFRDFPVHCRSLAQRISFYAMASDRPEGDVAAALCVNAPLRRFEVLDDDGDLCVGPFRDFLEKGSEALREGRFYKQTSVDDALPLSFHGDLAARHAPILKTLLATATTAHAPAILFYGPPGTGKTSFAKTLAHELSLDLAEIRQGDDHGHVNATARLTGYTPDVLSIKGDLPPSRVDAAVRRFHAADARAADPDRPRLHLLFYGTPGTGKTEFAKHLAREAGARLTVLGGSDLLSKYVGETEARIRAAFARARSERSILFLDEADGLLMERAAAQRSWELSQVDELLRAIENFEGVFVAATNFMDCLDPAVLRRFSLKLRFGYLTPAGKRLLFDRMFKLPLTPAETARLDAIPNLVPGDFRTVRQSLHYLSDAPPAPPPSSPPSPANPPSSATPPPPAPPSASPPENRMGVFPGFPLTIAETLPTHRKGPFLHPGLPRQHILGAHPYSPTPSSLTTPRQKAGAGTVHEHAFPQNA